MTTGIPPALYRRIEDVLVKCGPFDNCTELKAIFTDERISPWHKEVRDANTAAARVQVNVDFLRRQYNTAQENGLVLLLRVLSDAKDETDACHSELIVVADDLEQWLNRKRLLSRVSVRRKSLRNYVAIVGGLLIIIVIIARFFLLRRCPQATYGAYDDFDAMMVSIAGREFLMGDNSSGLPQHKVTVESFFIDRFEVTNQQYQRFVKDIGHTAFPATWQDDNFAADSAFHPVSGVSWEDALAYCRFVGKRLPTEAEWELACRGAENYPYPWGHYPLWWNANVKGNYCGSTLPVGGYSLAGDSPYGVADMLGNVIEWTSSIAAGYPYRADDGREDLANTEAWRISRGGMYGDNLLGCAGRIAALPYSRAAGIGFRCARDGSFSP